jgi:glycosyltransferase involved in cell wall biosynthesis
MKKKIKNNALFVLPTDMLGGAEKVSMNLIDYLHEQSIFSEIDVYFLCKGRSGRWVKFEGKKGINLFYNDYNSEKSSLPALFVFFLRHRRRYDFVYSTHMHINSCISLFLKLGLFSVRFKVARESTVISDRFRGVKGKLLSLLYKCYGEHDLLICQTEHMRCRLIETNNESIAKNIAVIPNPLAYATIRSQILGNSKKNVSGTSFNIIMVGRLVSVKNHQLALNAVAILNSKGKVFSGFKLIIVGEGQLRKGLENLARKLRISSYIKWVGYLESPYQSMAEADMGLLTSSKEGFPNVLLEMMASGTKYIMTTPCAGDLNSLKSIKIVDNFEAETLAEALDTAISEKNDFSKMYIEQASKRNVSGYWGSIEGYRN